MTDRRTQKQFLGTGNVAWIPMHGILAEPIERCTQEEKVSMILLCGRLFCFSDLPQPVWCFKCARRGNCLQDVRRGVTTCTGARRSRQMTFRLHLEDHTLSSRPTMSPDELRLRIEHRIQKLNIAANRTVESETFVSQPACTTFDKRAHMLHIGFPSQVISMQ